MRLTREQEYDVFLAKCQKESIAPSKELFEKFQFMVLAREQLIRSEAYQAKKRERERIEQRTVSQTIAEDGAIYSPLDDNYYSSEFAWKDHIKAHDVVEIGNENKKKRKKKETLA